MEHGSRGDRAPWEGQQQYPSRGYGQEYPQDQPWQPQQYDPAAHQRRLQGLPQEPAWQQVNYPSQDFPPRGPQQPSWQEHGQYQPRQPQRRRQSRWPLYAGIAALVVAAGGGAAYALTGHSGAAKPLTCKQQYTAWKTGSAGALAKSTFGADDAALTAAGKSEDIPAMDAALKKFGSDAAQLQAYPMPACADPAGYWPQMLADIKAAGDNAGSTSGLGGLVTAMAPLQKLKQLEAKLSAELVRTAGVKPAS
jgi:hypothetical protein